MQVYIANLGKYNEGELVGAWFTPPVDYDEMAERIGLNDEYAIHDYELPCYYSSLEELCEHADDIIHYPDCDDMTDIACYFIDEVYWISLFAYVENR